MDRSALVLGRTINRRLVEQFLVLRLEGGNDKGAVRIFVGQREMMPFTNSPNFVEKFLDAWCINRDACRYIVSHA